MKTTWLWILAPLIAFNGACSSSDSNTPTNTDQMADGATADPTGLSMDGNGADSGEPQMPGAPAQDDNPPVASGNVSAIGFLSASYDELDNATEWNAQFLRSPSAFPLSNLEEEINVSASDQCRLLESGIPDIGSVDDIDLDGLPFIPEFVSAGEAITVTSPAGTYTTLFSQNVFGFLIYQTADDVPVAGTIPTGLTADIPGAPGGFPGLSNVALPSAAPIEFTLDGTTISWTGTGDSVNIIFVAIADGNVLEQSVIECDLVDDGTHTLADELLPAGSVEYPVFLGTRTVQLVTQSSDAVLIATATADGFLNRSP